MEQETQRQKHTHFHTHFGGTGEPPKTRIFLEKKRVFLRVCPEPRKFMEIQRKQSTRIFTHILVEQGGPTKTDIFLEKMHVFLRVQDHICSNIPWEPCGVKMRVFLGVKMHMVLGAMLQHDHLVPIPFANFFIYIHRFACLDSFFSLSNFESHFA